MANIIGNTGPLIPNKSPQIGPEDSDLEPIEPSKMAPGLGSIDADSSWMAWQCSVQRITEHNQIRHKPLSGTITTTKPVIDPFGAVEPVSSDTTVPSSGWSSTVPDMTQQVASPSLTIVLVGYGVRIGSRVNPPKMITFGGQPAILKKENVVERQLFAGPDLVMFRTDWMLEYLIPGAPGSLPLPADPSVGSDGTAAVAPQSGVQG